MVDGGERNMEDVERNGWDLNGLIRLLLLLLLYGGCIYMFTTSEKPRARRISSLYGLRSIYVRLHERWSRELFFCFGFVGTSALLGRHQCYCSTKEEGNAIHTYAHTHRVYLIEGG